jgi:hypothetical protein
MDEKARVYRGSRQRGGVAACGAGAAAIGQDTAAVFERIERVWIEPPSLAAIRWVDNQFPSDVHCL